jgi:sarcosine oxidase subunit gamma
MIDDQLQPVAELPAAVFRSPRGYELRARPMACLLLALGLPGAEAPASLALRPAGPQTWFILGDAPLSPAEIAEREGGGVMLVDQTHGHERLEIAGPGAARKLAAGVAVDLSPSAFPEAASCNCLCGHIAVHLTRTGAESFELIVARSFAADLWQALTA